MANIYKFIPFILKWEGGYSDDPADLGGPTNLGVSIRTWQDAGYDKNDDGVIDDEDLKAIFIQDMVGCVLRPHYWDRWQADRIRNQSIANLLVDWLWTSGIQGVKIPQQLLNLKPDGIVGEKTLAAINNYPDPEELFNRLKSEREAYILRICAARPQNNRFKKGWLNRIADIKFALIMLVVVLSCCLPGCRSAVPASVTEGLFRTTSVVQNELSETTGLSSAQIVSKQTDILVDEALASETVALTFDTSVKDPITGRHPVKAISRTTLNKGTVSQSAETENRRLTQDGISETRQNNQTLTLRDENIRQKQEESKDPYRWRYLTIALFILISGFFGWVFFVRKNNPSGRTIRLL